MINVKSLVVCIFFVAFNPIYGRVQTVHFNAGLCVDFGSEVKRIGLRLNCNSHYEFVQFNMMAGLYFNFKSWGVQSKSPEIKIGGAALFGFGYKDELKQPFFGLDDHNLPNNYVVGYAYQYYIDWQSTSQATGLFAINYKNVTLLTENDLFGAGKGWRDRFRTGAFKVRYTYNELRFSANIQLYTGDYASCSKITDNPNFPARYGYRSQDKVIYGNKSLGILSIQGEYVGPYRQTARIDVGVNSEKVRNVVQNKALHDMPFYTDKMVKRQLMHIPMLQQDGTSYTYENNQNIRPAKFFYNLSINPSTFY